MPTIRIAIVSDMHCCHSHGASRPSYLTTSLARVPATNHPVQALLNLIETDGLSADLLLVPGDITNRADRTGLAAGLQFVTEIGAGLKASFLFTTIGNHDVESRSPATPPPTGRTDSHSFVRNVRPDFPTRDTAQCHSFWANGFYISDLTEFDLRVVVIDSTIGHVDEVSAERGTFDESRIDLLVRTLATLPPLPGIAVLHHHPVLHSIPGVTNADVLLHGDLLLSGLASHDVRLVVHGHRHVARMTYTADSLVFCAGSFSGMLDEMASYTRNTFHLMKLEVHEGAGAARSTPRGVIQTWEFHLGAGWLPTTDRSATFPHIAGFGVRLKDGHVDRLRELADAANGRTLSASELNDRFPDLQHFSPDDIAKLEKSLHPYRLRFARDHETSGVIGLVPVVPR